ncbi:hypothetical protein [Profundibacter sp.]
MARPIRAGVARAAVTVPTNCHLEMRMDIPFVSRKLPARIHYITNAARISGAGGSHLRQVLFSFKENSPKS